MLQAQPVPDQKPPVRPKQRGHHGPAPPDGLPAKVLHQGELEQDVVDREFDEADDDGDQGEAATRVSRAAAGVLRFGEERNPAALTQFVRLRVMGPEGAYWRRGIEAATRWRAGDRQHRAAGALHAPHTRRLAHWRLQKDACTLESGVPHAAA
jgi:hypothetical protein